MAPPDYFTNVYKLSPSQLIFYFHGALSKGMEQNASGRKWIDLQPIAAKKSIKEH